MCLKSYDNTQTVVDDKYLLELLENHLIYVKSLQRTVLIEYSRIEQEYLRNKVISLEKKIAYLKDKIRTNQIVTAT